MYVDDEPPEVKQKKPRKKVEKEVVPLGRNGLRKKKVMRSKMSQDAKGYMGRETARLAHPETESFPSSDRGLLLVRVR